MKNGAKIFIVALLMTGLIIAFGCAKAQKKPLANPDTTPKNAQQARNTYKPHVTAFYVEPGSEGSFASLQRYYKHIDMFSPLWLTVKADGSIKDMTDKTALEFAKKKGLKVIPLVNVANSNDIVLTTPEIRDKTIINLVQLLKTHDFDGYNIDFEFIPKGTKNYVHDKDLLTKFMSILREKMKPMGKTLNMSVIPHFEVSTDVSGIYDYTALAPLVDVVTLMLYDRHQASSPPGPVSPLKWADTNIRTTMDQGFKREQICVGVATYGYDWPVAKGGGYSRPTKEILREASQKGIDVKWSEEFHEPYYVYRDPDTGGNREVWFESSQTIKEKIDLVDKYKLHGICIWRLGFETPSFWKVIGEKIK
ncbi:glycoside hydrolase [Candidatus Formimonas warabiya]|uniref:Glycoside hydrolase n=2 Tax=Formimonas warabiya TaxID=1761012 RepID=A0A3G1L1H8_FORW1|nr:glycoside hydrolase [Candidatus Formimonas warabiya]